MYANFLIDQYLLELNWVRGWNFGITLKISLLTKAKTISNWAIKMEIKSWFNLRRSITIDQIYAKSTHTHTSNQLSWTINIVPLIGTTHTHTYRIYAFSVINWRYKSLLSLFLIWAVFSRLFFSIFCSFLCHTYSIVI